MTESLLLTCCLLMGTGCLIVMTVVITMLARDVRAAARRISEVMPHGEELIQRSRHAVERLHAVLTQAEEAMRHVRTVTARVCAAAADTFEAVATARRSATTWIEEHFGHGLGNGTGSRRSRRRSREMEG